MPLKGPLGSLFSSVATAIFPAATPSTRIAEAEKHKNSGNELFQEQRVVQAISKYSEGLSSLDGLDDAAPVELRVALLSNRALCWLKLEDGAAAKSDTIRAIRADPDHIKSYYRLATALQMLNDNNGALGVCDAALKRFPNSLMQSSLVEKQKELLKKGATSTPFEVATTKGGGTNDDEEEDNEVNPEFVRKEDTPEAEALMCGICMDVWQDPRSLPCSPNHVFCKGCITGLQSSSGKKREKHPLCPLCRKEFTKTVMPPREVFDALFSLPGSCDSCDWTGTRKEFAISHKRSCRGRSTTADATTIDSQHHDEKMVATEPSLVQQINTHISKMRQDGQDLVEIRRFIQSNPIETLGESNDDALYLYLTSRVFLDLEGSSMEIISKLEKSLEIQERLCTDITGGFLRLKTVGTLGEACCELVDLIPEKLISKKAIQYLEEEKRLVEQGCGSGGYIGRILTNLGRLYRRNGDKDKALNLHKEALELFTKQYGSNHAEVALGLNELGVHFYSTGDLESANKYSEKAVQMIQSLHGPNCHSLRDSLKTWGRVRRALGDDKMAIELFERALRLYEEADGPNSPYLTSCLTELATTCFLTHPEKAKKLCERALQILEANYGTDHRKLINALHYLGNANQCLKKYPEAIRMYERALRIGETEPTCKDKVADIKGNMANLYLQQKQNDKALELYNKALEIKEELYGVDDKSCSDVLFQIGWCHSNAGHQEKAVQFFKRSLTIRKAHLGPIHLEVAQTQCSLGLEYVRMGEKSKARPHLDAALKTRKQFFPAGHPLVLQVQMVLAASLAKD